MKFKRTRGQAIRCFKIGEKNFRTEISWHFLNSGERYYYVHVYRGNHTLPYKRWTWVADENGKFKEWV